MPLLSFLSTFSTNNRESSTKETSITTETKSTAIKPFLRKLPIEIEIKIIDTFINSDKKNIRIVVLLNRTYWELYHKKLFMDVRIGFTNSKRFDTHATPQLPPPPLLPPQAPLNHDEMVSREKMEVNWRHHERFKSICKSIVYLKIKDMWGGQQLVNALVKIERYRKLNGMPRSTSNPEVRKSRTRNFENSSSNATLGWDINTNGRATLGDMGLFPNLKYLILGNGFVNDCGLLQVQESDEFDNGYKALSLLHENVHPRHVCIRICMKNKPYGMFGKKYRFDLRGLKPLFENQYQYPCPNGIHTHGSKVETLTQHLDNSKKPRFIMENIKLNRFFIPTFPNTHYYGFTGISDPIANHHWINGIHPHVEVGYNRKRLRDKIYGIQSTPHGLSNYKLMPSKYAEPCICCGEKQR